MVVVAFVLNAFTPHVVSCASQKVSDFMTCAAGFVLTAFTPTLVPLGYHSPAGE